MRNQLFVTGLILTALACGNSTTPATPRPTRADADAQAPAATEAAPPTEAPTEAAPVAETYQTGQNVIVGEVRWKILQVQNFGQTIKSTNQFIKDLTTSGKFISIGFEVENKGKEMKTFAGITVVDSQGREFQPNSDAIMLIDSDEQCVFENLNPGIVKICQVVYEVPADATGLKANVGDLEILGGDEALIELGL